MQPITATPDRYNTRQWALELIETLAGLNPGFRVVCEDTSSYLERAQEARIGFGARRQEDTIDAAKQRLRSKVADGEVAVADMPRLLAELDAQLSTDVRKQYRMLSESCEHRAWKAMADAALAIQARLSELVGGWVTEARDLRADIGTAGSAVEAMATPKSATAWSKLLPLAQQFDTAVEAMATLRLWGCLPIVDVEDERQLLAKAAGRTLDERIVQASYWCDRPAEMVTALKGDERPRLLVALDVECTLGLFLAEQAIEHLEPVVHVDTDELAHQDRLARGRRMESGTGGVVPDTNPAVERLADAIQAAGSGA